MSNTPVRDQARQSPPLRGVRLARGLTLAEVGEAADVHLSTLSMAERGMCNLSVAQLYRVAKALGIEEVSKHLKPFVLEEVSA